MIKAFTAVTREIDDTEVAVEEILAALEPQKNLLKNSLGLISCYSEFIETGVLKAVCDALPFGCVGATTSIASAGKETDRMMLTLTVLTSDDCSFETVKLPLTENVGAPLLPLLDRGGEKPALLLGYFPILSTMCGDTLIEGIDKVTGGIPIYGTTAVDHSMDFSTAQTIYNGEGFRDAVTLGLIYGNVNYSFGVASLNDEKIRKQKAVITEAKDNIIISINDKTAYDYLIEIGITKADIESGTAIIPFVIDHKGGTKPVARGVLALTPEGYAVCGGGVNKDMTLAVGRVDVEDVLSTAETLLKPLAGKDGVILSYSCIARYLALGTKYTAEADKVIEVCKDMQYLYVCAGGEICPLPDENGKLKNYYHNYTNVFCKLS